MNNTVIKVLNKEHGKRVIKYFSSLGFDTREYEGSISEADNGLNSNIYYGVINNRFNNFTFSFVQDKNAKIIELPTRTIKSLKNNEVIHCKTEEEANRICKLFHEAGNNWNGGESYLTDNCYLANGDNTVYYKHNTYGSIHKIVRNTVVLDSSEFVSEDKIEIMKKKNTKT